jgi:hypothetical protein
MNPVLVFAGQDQHGESTVLGGGAQLAQQLAPSHRAVEVEQYIDRRCRSASAAGPPSTTGQADDSSGARDVGQGPMGFIVTTRPQRRRHNWRD